MTNKSLTGPTSPSFPPLQQAAAVGFVSDPDAPATPTGVCLSIWQGEEPTEPMLHPRAGSLLQT